MTTPSEPHEWRLADCDPEFLRFLQDQADVLGGRSYSRMTPEEARAAYRRVARARPVAPDPEREAVTTTAVQIRAGSRQIEIRIYRPSTDRILPTVVFFHGGGWVFGDLDSYDDVVRFVCTATGALVVGVDYPLAPEHPFPAALDACVASIEWVAENIGAYGGDPDRIVLMGDSAGGNLAAATALECTDRGRPITGQAILYAPLVHVDEAATAGLEPWESRRQRFGPSSESAAWYWANYLPRTEDSADPRASLLLRTIAGGAPPAYIGVGELDSFASECAAYARMLEQAGAQVRFREYPKISHGFLAHGPLSADVRSEVAHAAAIDACDSVRSLAFHGRLNE